jgi:hypothetical protein
MISLAEHPFALNDEAARREGDRLPGGECPTKCPKPLNGYYLE